MTVISSLVELEVAMPEKVTLSLDKHSWHPSPLLGQIVLVTTSNADGTSNIAPKSWISMMAFEPPLLALACNRQHWTAQNILQRHAFVVNVPGAELAETVWQVQRLPHPRPVEASGLTALPALKVAPPRVAECKAHLECCLVEHLSYGDELIFLGQILAVSADQQALSASDPYAYLRMIVFLEQGKYGVIEQAQHLTKRED
jgi:flavin reductase (DIM6/NTAB) family NADH-FMN oxidoreductase RutF